MNVKNNTLKRTISVLAEVLDVNPDKINIESSTKNTRGWDSFMTTLFIIAVEREFNVSIQIEDAENFTCVESVVRIINSKYSEE